MKSDKPKFEILFGAMAPDFKDQLQEFEVKLPDDDCARFNRSAQSITYLHIHGILSDAETHRARQRLIKQMKNKITVRKTDKGYRVWKI